MDIDSISPDYYCRCCETTCSAQGGLYGPLMSRVETETETPSLSHAEQAASGERREDRAPVNVNTGDRALTRVQHGPIHLTAFSITSSPRFREPGVWMLDVVHTHPHSAPVLQIPVHYCPGAHWQGCHSPRRWMLLLGQFQTSFIDSFVLLI